MLKYLKAEFLLQRRRKLMYLIALLIIGLSLQDLFSFYQKALSQLNNPPPLPDSTSAAKYSPAYLFYWFAPARIPARMSLAVANNIFNQFLFAAAGSLWLIDDILYRTGSFLKLCHRDLRRVYLAKILSLGVYLFSILLLTILMSLLCSLLIFEHVDKSNPIPGLFSVKNAAATVKAFTVILGTALFGLLLSLAGRSAIVGVLGTVFYTFGEHFLAFNSILAAKSLPFSTFSSLLAHIALQGKEGGGGLLGAVSFVVDPATREMVLLPFSLVFSVAAFYIVLFAATSYLLYRRGCRR